jgi:phosphatidylethanolamine/phosphatidyl-N-methylethanolamine N-methyltransferase
VSKRVSMDEAAVRDAYRRWAPVYDWTFGAVAEAGRQHAVRIINQRKGRVLEVGVGTGLSLPDYGRHLTVTGIDLSPEMLAKARERVERERLDHVVGLHEMDASALDFSDESFDVVVAMYVMTVVPDPDAVMVELERVCAPGGEVLLVNHFSRPQGVRGAVERGLAPLAQTLGWHPVFPVERVMTREHLRLMEQRSLKPLGLFTMLRFVKQGGAGGWQTLPMGGMMAKDADSPRDLTRGGRLQRRRLKPSFARLAVHARRLLDSRSRRSLYRRITDPMAE